MNLLETCLKNKWLKLSSLLLAVIAWAYVSNELSKTRELRVPLILKEPEGTFILEQSYRTVKLSLRGPAATVSRLDEKSLSLEIDVAKKLKGKLPTNFTVPQPVDISIKISDVRNLPPNVTVTRFDPDRPVTVTLDEMTEKLLTVEVDKEKDLSGKVGEGFKIHKAYSETGQVLVRGPKSVLAARSAIRPGPDPITIANLTRNFKIERTLDTRGEVGGDLIDCLQPKPPKVYVMIEVFPNPEKKTIKNVPIEVRGRPGLLYTMLTPDKTKPFTEIPEVQIEGRKQLLDDPKLRAFVDVTDIKDPKLKPEVKREVQFSAEPGIKALTEPPQVVVQIKAIAPE